MARPRRFFRRKADFTVNLGIMTDTQEIAADSEPDWEKIHKFLEPKPPIYCPHEPYPKQKAFLRSEAFEVLYGGRAAGGKSDALIMAALQYADVPGYAGMIFRNSYADLSLPGAIMDRAKDWFGEYPEVRWSKQASTAYFPSGATLSFGYLQNADDHLRYKGAEFQYLGFDELTEIREQSYRYMLSRLRKPSVESGQRLARVPLRARSASNPAANWVRRYFLEEGPEKGRLYIPAGYQDNPYIDHASYAEALSRLSPVDRAQLEGGDWYAVESGKFFNASDFDDNIVAPEEVPERARYNLVRYWDLAATEPSESNRDPDWTVGALCAIVDGYFWILDIQRFRGNSAEVERRIKATAYDDGPRVKVRMDQDPGQAGKAQVSHYGRHVLLGYDFAGFPVVKDKEARVNLWAPKVKRGEVKLKGGGGWINDFKDEALGFGSETNLHDDQMDAVSGAFETLTGVNLKKQRSTVRIIV